jgi:hypothetical protein
MILTEYVEMSWNTINKEYYEQRDYKFTKMRDKFIVKVSDLPPSSAKKVLVKCDCCGKEYELNYRHCSNKEKHLCNYCYNTRYRQNKNRLTFEIVKIKFESENYNVLSDKSEFVKSKSKLKVQCPKGHIYDTSYDNFSQGKRCRLCSYEKLRSDRAFDYIDIKNKIESVDGYKLISDKYVNCDTKLQIQCNEGHIFEKIFYNFSNLGQRCPICGQSNGEKRVRNYLDSNNIKYAMQYTFNDLIDTDYLRFDFAMFYNNELECLIEYDGEGHYEPCFGKESLIKTQIHDEMKNAYCIKNNIKLIRIPYWDYENIEFILNEYISNL